MLHFHPLQVKKLVHETADSVSIEFDVPADLQDTFRFQCGQNLTIRKELDGEELRRNYSICTSPFENKLKVAVKAVEGGRFSRFAKEELKEGDVLEVMPPSGNFRTTLRPDQKKSYLAFAAGSGITPVLSIIKTTLATEPASEFTLVYGNRTKNHILFRDELQDIKDRHLSRFRLYHVLSREKTDAELNSGRIDTKKLELFFSTVLRMETVDEYFLCGPEEMIFCIKGFLEARGVEPSKIHFELFTVPGQKNGLKPATDAKVETSGPSSKIKVKLDGILFEFDLPMGGDNILDAALRQGADLPYACKGGVCTTCKARLLEGEVKMDVNWGLEPDELAAGYVLTCQSHPVTPTVTVDFDAK